MEIHLAKALPLRPLIRFLALLAVTAHGQGIIGINLTDAVGNNRLDPINDTAGVVPAAYWNNLPVTGSKEIKIDRDLLYNNGAPVGGGFSVSATLRQTNVKQQDQSGHEGMFAGYALLRDASGMASVDLVTTSGTVLVSNIPYKKYSVYVYVRGESIDTGGSVQMGDTIYYVKGAASGKSADTFSGAKLIRTTANTGDSAKESNYALFANLSGARQAIMLNAVDYSGKMARFYVAGIQIVDTSFGPASTP